MVRGKPPREISRRGRVGNPLRPQTIEKAFVIAPQFSKCGSFGRKGALVQARRNEQAGVDGAIGLIGWRGEWLQTLPYDGFDGNAGLGRLQWYTEAIPGYAAVSVK